MIKIREMLLQGKSQRLVAEAFGVSKWSVQLIQAGIPKVRPFHACVREWMESIGIRRCSSCGLWRDITGSAHRCLECNRDQSYAKYESVKGRTSRSGPTKAWTKEEIALLWKLPLATVAKMTGRTQGAVSGKRNRMKYPRK